MRGLTGNKKGKHGDGSPAPEAREPSPCFVGLF